jgi:SpoVK/Ycf46/Vps4 family AAA+-type ATPase
VRVAAPPTAPAPPAWHEDLNTLYQGRIARQFVVHFNLNDLVLDLSERLEAGHGEYRRRGAVVPNRTGRLLTLREYLRAFLFDELYCEAVYTYSLAGGLGAEDAFDEPAGSDRSGPAWRRLREAVATLQLAQDGGDLPESVPDCLGALGHLLRQPPASGRRSAESRIAVLIDYVEKLVPYRLEEGGGDRDGLQAMEVLQRWAVDPVVRSSNNVILLLTDNLGQIPTSLHAEGSGCRAIRVPLPTEREREAFIRHKLSGTAGPFASLDAAEYGSGADAGALALARDTQGMRLTDIDNISRRVIVEHRRRAGGAGPEPSDAVLRGADVQRAKSEVIQAQSAGLLEIVPPSRGFAEIGGLETVKAYLRERTRHMRSGRHVPLVPSGLLLAGPPGTGKTIIAEAIALESRFNLVKMRSIQDKWVGSSERNLEMVLSLLDDLHPVVVFIDEIDQAMGRRDTGQGGDNGVGARMFGRVLEAMSDSTRRGRILWVAATNRADLLDDALLRRFDRVIPLLTPDVRESCHIFATMPRTIARQSGDDMTLEYGGGLERRPPEMAGTPDDPFFEVAQRTAALGLTGAAIEIVVRRAIEMAHEEARDERSLPSILPDHLKGALRDFKVNHDRDRYDHQSLLAIRACNFHSVIPELPDRDPYRRLWTDGQIDPYKLDQEIAVLATGVRR